MLINTSLSADTTAAKLQSERLAATNKPQPQPQTSAPVASQTSGLSAIDLDGDNSVVDSAGADQAAQLLTTGFSSQPALAFAAQANLNPETAFNLLQ